MLSLLSLFVGNVHAQEPVERESSTLLNLDVGRVTSSFVDQYAAQMNLFKKKNRTAFGLNAAYAIDMGSSSIKNLSYTLVSIAASRSAEASTSIPVALSGLSLMGFGQYDWFTGMNVRQRPVQYWVGGGVGVVQEKRYLVEPEQVKFQKTSWAPVIMPNVGGRVFLSDTLSLDVSVGVRYNILELDSYTMSRMTTLSTGIGMHF